MKFKGHIPDEIFHRAGYMIYNPPANDGNFAGESPHQRRFSGTVRSDNRPVFAAIYLPERVRQNKSVKQPDCNVVKRNEFLFCNVRLYHTVPLEQCETLYYYADVNVKMPTRLSSQNEMDDYH